MATTASFVIVSRNDIPIYEAEVGSAAKRDDAVQQHQFVLHAALDIVQDLAWTTSAMFLKSVDRFNDMVVSVYVTAGHTRLMLLHDSRNDDGIKSFFQEVHELYIKKAKQVSVYLPAKQLWYDLKTGRSYEGRKTHILEAREDGIPSFQKAGTIIPRKDRFRQSSTQMVNDPYTLVIALNSSLEAEGELYIDDGKTFEFAKGKFIHRRFVFSNGKLSSSNAAHKSQQHPVYNKQCRRKGHYFRPPSNTYQCPHGYLPISKDWMVKLL